MDLKSVLVRLLEDFDVSNVKDDWSWMFDDLFMNKSIPSFRRKLRHTGLMFKNSDEVRKIYTAFAPNTYLLQEIKRRGITDTLLIVKHPFDWDGSKKGQGFIHISEKDYKIMEEMRISVYSLHTPMDRNRNNKIVSTAYGFARTIGLKVKEEFAPEGPRNPKLILGLIGELKDKDFDSLCKRLSKLLDYKVKTMKSNDEVGKVAVVTGGGFVPEIIQEARDKGCTTYITGIITPNASEYSKQNYPKTLEEVKKIEGINIIGCSHYLTEKWAMLFSIPYFEQFCPTEFIEDKAALK